MTRNDKVTTDQNEPALVQTASEEQAIRSATCTSVSMTLTLKLYGKPRQTSLFARAVENRLAKPECTL
jgi:hypothetical protein